MNVDVRPDAMQQWVAERERLAALCARYGVSLPNTSTEIEAVRRVLTERGEYDQFVTEWYEEMKR